MSGTVEARLAEMGFGLPAAAAPKVARIRNWKISGSLLFVSGQVPRIDGEIAFIGKVGREFTLEEGQDAARTSALMVLGCAKDALGDLDRIEEIVRVNNAVHRLSQMFTGVREKCQ